jgi:hypothetical protein
MMDLQLKIVGVLLIILAIAHAFFPKYFKWKQDLAPLSLINRQMFYVHSFFIGLVVLLMGLLCVTSTEELLNTNLGKRICLCLAAFWTARLAVQFFAYSPKLWKGKAFETATHVMFSIFWIYLAAVFSMSYLR